VVRGIVGVEVMVGNGFVGLDKAGDEGVTSIDDVGGF
jgi:hypothetical protein